MKKKVSIRPNMTVLITGGLGSHMYLAAPPPPPPPPTPGLHFEVPIPVFWPPGYGQHQLAASVKHQGSPLALEDHDCGAGIPHMNVAPPPINALLALHIPFSSRKFVFSSSKTKANGKPIATSDIASVPLPMMCCMDPVSAPVGFPVDNIGNTVQVGVEPHDLAIGAVIIGASVITDLICHFGGGGGKFSIGNAVASKLLGGSNPAEILFKSLVGTGVGLFKLYARGEGTVDVVSVGSPFGQFKVTLDLAKNGDVKVGWELAGSVPAVPAKGKIREESRAERGERGTPKRSAEVETPFGTWKPGDDDQSNATAATRDALVGDVEVL